MPQDSFGSLITATNSPDRSVSHQELNSGAGLAAVIHLFRGKPCTLIHEDGGADLAKPLCSQPSEGGDQQLIWTDNMDFITLWLHVAVPEGAALCRPLSCVSMFGFGLGAEQALRTEATLFIPGFLSFYQVLFIFKHLFNLSCKMKTIASAAFYLSTGGAQADTHIKALGIFIIPDSVISSGV